MDTDLDTLATALFVKNDDLLKSSVAAELSELPALRLGRGDLLVQDGSFVGVVAETHRAALRAPRRVARAAQWKRPGSPGPLPDERDLRAFLLAAPAEPQPVVEQPDPGSAAVVSRTLTAEFSCPFVAHASIAPSCAIARWDGESVTVWSHSQGIFALRGGDRGRAWAGGRAGDRPPRRRRGRLRPERDG